MSDLARYVSLALFAIGFVAILLLDVAYPVKLGLAALLGLAWVLLDRLAARNGWWVEHN